MKKILTLLLVLALSIAVFASCDMLVKIPGVGDLVTELCEHEWVDATCTTVKTCTKCGKTEGEALGHTWNAATCTEAKTCSVCGATEGEAAGHTWKNATCTEAKKCSVCGVTEGEALGHSYGTDGNCVCGKMDPLYEALLDASAYIRQLYKDDPTYTPADLNLVANVTIGDYVFPIVWTVNATEISVIATPDGKSVIVDIPDITEDSIKEIPYTLTATVSTENGYVATRTFEHVVPKFEVNTWEDYAKAETGTPLMVEGIVVLINSKSAGNTRNNLFVMDATGVGGYYNYQMETDPIADLGIKVGMTVRISGEAAPYNGLPEFKNATVKIIDETIKTFDFIDITEKFQKDTNYNLLVALPVVIKGVTLGDQDLTEKSQYMKFSLNGVESYIRTYVTDFPAGVLDADDKVVIDTLHKENFGNKADVYGILITYSGNPYLIPVSVDCFTNIQQPERTDAEKLELELGGITLPEAVTEDTVINLPLTGSAYETVKFSWKVDNEAFVIGEDGKVEIKLSGNAVTLKFTLTATVGEETATKEFTVEVASNFVMSETLAYTPFINQVKAGKVLYLDGGVSGRYLTTTTDPSKAVDVYAEKAEGGYKFYILVDDAKQYINLYLNDEGKTSVNYAETTNSVFTYNPVTNALCTTLNNEAVYLGTYNTFETISVSSCSYINADNTGVSQFPLELLAARPDGEYTGSLVQGKLENKVLYLDGGVSGRYLTTTADSSKAVTLYAEMVEGGFKFYILVDGEKQYVNLYKNSEDKLSVNYDKAGTSVFNYNPLVNAWSTVFDGSEYYLGTYNTFETISASALSYITPENTGVSQFPLEYFPIVKEECAHEWADATCTEAKKCGKCGVTEGEALGHKINAETHLCTVCGKDDPEYYWPMTIPEAVASADGKLVSVKGTVKEINDAWSDQYKNITVTIEDAEGNTLYIYRLKTNVAVGDKVTITGKVSSYNGAKQIASGATAVIEKDEPVVTGPLVDGTIVDKTMSSNLSYITNNESYPDAGFYSDGGLKLNFVNQGVSTQAFAAQKAVKVTLTFNALNENTKSENASVDAFTFYGLDAAGNVVATVTANTIADDKTVTVTLSGEGIVSVKFIMTDYYHNGNKCCNLSLAALKVETATASEPSQPSEPETPAVKPECTIPEALEREDGADVIVTGTVIADDKNNSVTIKDADGNELYAYKVSTPVAVGDVVTLTGKMGTYNDNRQIAQGATAVINTKHTCDYAAATCSVKELCKLCGAEKEGSAYLEHTWVDATCIAAKHCSVCNKAEGEFAAHTYGADGNCTVCGLNQNDSNVIVNIANHAANNSWENGKLYAEIAMNNDIKVTSAGTASGNYGLNTGKYYANDEGKKNIGNWRIYQAESGTITITAAEGKTIKAVKVNYISAKTGILLNGETQVLSGNLIIVNAGSVTLGVGNTTTTTNGNIQITSIEVIYN